MSKAGAFHNSDTDWDSVTVLSKKPPAAKTIKNQADLNAARSAGITVEAVKKYGAGRNKQHAGPQNATKIDAMTEPDHIKKVSHDVGKAIMQGRQAKELTQKQLAQKINELATVVADYETGKAIPNQQVLAKMERALGIKLRGKDIGTPFESKKTSSTKKS